MVNFEACRSKFSLIIPTIFYQRSSSASQGTGRFEDLGKKLTWPSQKTVGCLCTCIFLSPFFSPPTFLKRKNMNLGIVSNISLVALVVTHLAGTVQQSFQHAALPNRPDPSRDTSSVRKVLIWFFTPQPKTFHFVANPFKEDDGTDFCNTDTFSILETLPSCLSCHWMHLRDTTDPLLANAQTIFNKVLTISH